MCKFFDSCCLYIENHFICEKCLPFWRAKAGPKTIHFWAPTWKWMITIIGLKEIFTRPRDKLSFWQSLMLFITGAIWSRYSLVIIPKNWNLFSVNFFLFTVHFTQFWRAYTYKCQKDPSQRVCVKPFY